MLQGLTGWHALVVLAVILLVFGATRLPALARSVGQSLSILKREVAEPTRAPADAPTDADASAAAPTIARP
ncbi:Sec-independent protein translocase subunit TatA/TatB [Agrococcus jejuensis]|uniref:Sec-independent protein translocase protein TatA n=1 Tax=Agrococcus jejuensis TaxID=399736 RepID=A0A1G8F1K9_9MICO|nr:twin-arginine translocase TatA/TatE family subunit [Agrococcus jejuensis]SDH75997.1 sec-independent protein translocase protein TatA [Agrococcus jejuensis]